jgi:hypothetical protein
MWKIHCQKTIQNFWDAILVEELKASRRLRNLLYEKGKPLENAIIDGLTTGLRHVYQEQLELTCFSKSTGFSLHDHVSSFHE